MKTTQRIRKPHARTHKQQSSLFLTSKIWFSYTKLRIDWTFNIFQRPTEIGPFHMICLCVYVKWWCLKALSFSRAFFLSPTFVIYWALRLSAGYCIRWMSPLRRFPLLAFFPSLTVNPWILQPFFIRVELS